MVTKWKHNLSLDYESWACQAVRQQSLRRGEICQPAPWETAKAQQEERALTKAATDVLERIEKNRVGEILLKRIESTNKQVTVEGQREPSAEPTSIQDATPKGKPALQCSKDSLGTTPRPSTPKIGTGKGSDATARFIPGLSGCGVGVSGCPVSKQDDEVLFHELVHTLRMAAGLYHCQKIRGGKKETYTNEEEFYAVLITNIYMSEKGQTNLRCCHPGKGILTDQDKKQFVKTHRPLLEKLKSQQPRLFQEIAGVEPKGKFNPIREFAQSQGR